MLLWNQNLINLISYFYSICIKGKYDYIFGFLTNLVFCGHKILRYKSKNISVSMKLLLQVQYIGKFRTMVGTIRWATYSGHTWLAGQFRNFWQLGKIVAVKYSYTMHRSAWSWLFFSSTRWTILLYILGWDCHTA